MDYTSSTAYYYYYYYYYYTFHNLLHLNVLTNFMRIHWQRVVYFAEISFEHERLIELIFISLFILYSTSIVIVSQLFQSDVVIHDGVS